MTEANYLIFDTKNPGRAYLPVPAEPKTKTMTVKDAAGRTFNMFRFAEDDREIMEREAVARLRFYAEQGHVQITEPLSVMAPLRDDV